MASTAKIIQTIETIEKNNGALFENICVLCVKKYKFLLTFVG